MPLDQVHSRGQAAEFVESAHMLYVGMSKVKSHVIRVQKASYSARKPIAKPSQHASNSAFAHL